MLFQGHKVRILHYTSRFTQTYLRLERPVEALSEHGQKINLDIRSICDFRISIRKKNASASTFNMPRFHCFIRDTLTADKNAKTVALYATLCGLFDRTIPTS